VVEVKGSPLFRVPPVTPSPVSVSQTAAVLSRLMSSQEKGRKKMKGVSFFWSITLLIA